MAYAAGVDVGSTQTKAVIINEAGEIVGRALIDTGANVIAAAETAFGQALASHQLDEREIEYVVGTGYGRYRVTFGNTQVTEISCHGRGAVYMFPNTRTVVDMGGQDTKAIRVSATGEIIDFCIISQGFHLGINRLFLGLGFGADTGVQCNFHRFILSSVNICAHSITG